MKQDHLATLARHALDNQMKVWARRPPPLPYRGWIHTLREALGLSALQLGKRLSISQTGIVALEQSEVKGTLRLATLRRVAEAMDCTLAYALIPNRPLETMVRDRRRRLARREMAGVLERSGLSPREELALLDAYGERIKARRVWEVESSLSREAGED